LAKYSLRMRKTKTDPASLVYNDETNDFKQTRNSRKAPRPIYKVHRKTRQLSFEIISSNPNRLEMFLQRYKRSRIPHVLSVRGCLRV